MKVELSGHERYQIEEGLKLRRAEIEHRAITLRARSVNETEEERRRWNEAAEMCSDMVRVINSALKKVSQ